MLCCSFDRHVTDVVRGCNYHLMAIRHIRARLTTEAAKSVTRTIVTRLDYCNSLLYGTTESNLDRLQVVQNLLARTVCRAPWTASATELRRSLHWHRIRHRILYKTALITYKVQGIGSPSYLAELIKPYEPVLALRSSSLRLLCVPLASINFAQHAFSISAPTVWNSLSLDTRLADYLNI